jgi:hypothetical protein
MKIDNILGLAAVMGLFGLLILILLWPGRKHGLRLLGRWGVTGPSEVDIEESVRYLKRRRFWYPWLLFVIPLASQAIGLRNDGRADWWTVAWTVLLGGVLGELLALRRPSRAHREAMLAHRGVTDLVPAWALTLLGISIAGGVVRTIMGREWAQLGVTIGCAAVVAVVVALALRRPAAGDATVDLVLRARSARVATGLAIVAPAAIPEYSVSFASALVFVLSLAACIAVVTPDRHLATALT